MTNPQTASSLLSAFRGLVKTLSPPDRVLLAHLIEQQGRGALDRFERAFIEATAKYVRGPTGTGGDPGDPFLRTP